VPLNCELTLTLSVVLYLVRTANKVDVRLLQTEHLTNGDQRKETDTLKGNIFLQDIYILSSKVSPVIRDPSHAAKSSHSPALITLHCNAAA
jgi:hypothetical protein